MNSVSKVKPVKGQKTISQNPYKEVGTEEIETPIGKVAIPILKISEKVEVPIHIHGQPKENKELITAPEVILENDETTITKQDFDTVVPITAEKYTPKGQIISLIKETVVSDWPALSQVIDMAFICCDDALQGNVAACRTHSIPFSIYFDVAATNLIEAELESIDMLDALEENKCSSCVLSINIKPTNGREIFNKCVNILRENRVTTIGYVMTDIIYSIISPDTTLIDFVCLKNYGTNDTGEYSGISPRYRCDLHEFTCKGKVNGVENEVSITRIMSNSSKSIEWLRDNVDKCV